MSRYKSGRRKFLKAGVFVGLSGCIAMTKARDYLPRLHATPPEIEGPFYPIIAQKDKDFDLTRVNGRNGVAKGTIIVIEGQVADTNGDPVEDASVELWQANAAGRYSHPFDSNPAPLDPDFQGWAIVLSGRDGGFRFKTVMPGSYPAAEDWIRPPHIHYKISKSGYVELITQMYFPGHPLNEKDLLFNRKTPEEQTRMLAQRIKAGETTYRYQIVLEKV